MTVPNPTLSSMRKGWTLQYRGVQNLLSRKWEHLGKRNLPLRCHNVISFGNDLCLEGQSAPCPPFPSSLELSLKLGHVNCVDSEGETRRKSNACLGPSLYGHAHYFYRLQVSEVLQPPHNCHVSRCKGESWSKITTLSIIGLVEPACVDSFATIIVRLCCDQSVALIKVTIRCSRNGLIMHILV